MSDFSFKRDFKNIQWKSTIGLNLLRSAIAGVVWFFIGLLTSKTAAPMLFFPLIYLVIILPFGLFDLFLRDRGVPWAGLVGFFFNLALSVADPIMYILHRTVPRIVPVDRYKFIERNLVIFVLNNPDFAANEYNAPKEIDREEVKELLSSKIRLDEEVNFLKEEPEEVIADEETRDGKTSHTRAGGHPTLEISNSIFNFNDLRSGSTITDTFAISNAGGDKLSGSIKANRKWLKVFQSEIDPTQRKQDVIFRVNTSGLAFGFHDTGTIEIKSNAGIERVNVTISVEAEPIALLRKEKNIPVIAGLGVLGVAIAVTVFAWQMALKTEKEAKLVKLKTEQKQAQQTNQEKHEYAIAQQKTSTIEQSTLGKKETEKSASQEAVNNCFDTVSPARWKGEYYNNGKLSGSPSMVRDDGSDFINFAWGDFSPGQYCGISKDYFSVRWTRTVNFAKGTYRFTATIRDVRLYIDDIMKLEEGFIEPRTYTVDVPLTEGKHTIKMKYRESSINGIVKLAWQVLPTSEQSKVQTPVTINISGEWEGNINNKPAKLSITQDGNSLKGNIVSDDVTEHLSGEINNDQIVLRGTGYDGKVKEGESFALDTFSGTISNQDGDFIHGNYTDEAGHSGTWFAKRKTTILTQESTANQNKKQQSKDIYEPRPAIPIHQVKLTNALQKRPSIVVKKWYRGKCDIKSTMAKLEMSENGDLTVQSVDISVECKWSSRESSYIGTWRDARRTRGKVILRPIYNDSGEIKCFSGHLGVGNGPLNAVIKVSNLLCLCPDPPDHNPSTRDQYRKPKSPSVHTYETNRSYHWGK